jgi:hypothetical protein
MPHFFLKDATGKIVACIATERLGDNNMRYAVSVMNPKDDFESRAWPRDR